MTSLPITTRTTIATSSVRCDTTLLGSMSVPIVTKNTATKMSRTGSSRASVSCA